jgi:hypothetical protein
MYENIFDREQLIIFVAFILQTDLKEYTKCCEQEYRKTTA